MKKFISLALVAVMVLSMSLFMASCGGDKEEAGGGEAAESKDITITGVIATQLGDKSFNDSAKAGLDKLKEQGFKVNVVQCDTDETKYEPSLRTAAENSDIVVGVGSELTMIDKIVGDYPDTKFIWVDNVVKNPEKYDNLTCIRYTQNEGSYLVGYIAGKMTESNVVGFIGGQKIDVIEDFRIGYEQGVKDANPKAKVLKNWTNDWSDTNAGAEAAQTQAGQGADIIFCAAGGSGNGAILKAEELGIKCIGVDQDQRETMKDYADYILCSMIKNVDKSLVDYINDFTEDESKWVGPEVFNAGPKGDYIKVAYGPEDLKVLVPQDIIDELDTQIEKIDSGEIDVKSAFDK
ncbi:MAG: BMP family ABC transporter substrate-binding protein [Emergencia sp.]|nr:BMP family ABC transporter substrate-binding protein [Emergencia sp.]